MVLEFSGVRANLLDLLVLLHPEQAQLLILLLLGHWHVGAGLVHASGHSRWHARGPRGVLHALVHWRNTLHQAPTREPELLVPTG